MPKLTLPKNLPDKSYFTIDELAEKWECDNETIINYIEDQKILSKALYTKKQSCISLFKLDGMTTQQISRVNDTVKSLYENFLKSKAPFLEPLRFQAIDTIHFKELRALNTAKWSNGNQINEEDIPSFLYVVEDELIKSYDFVLDNIDLKIYQYYLIVKDFKGNKYLLMNVYAQTITPVHPYMFNVISKEEVERFDKVFLNPVTDEKNKIDFKDEKECFISKSDPIESVLDKAFPATKLSGIASIFKLKINAEESLSEWKSLSRKAKENGLIVARIRKGKGKAESEYNVIQVSEWLVKEAKLSQDIVNRALKRNLPEKYNYLSESF